MVSKKVQRLVRELDEVRKKIDPQSQEKARELSYQIPREIPRRILEKALQHPPEIRNLISPLDTSRHPLLL